MEPDTSESSDSFVCFHEKPEVYVFTVNPNNSVSRQDALDASHALFGQNGGSRRG